MADDFDPYYQWLGIPPKHQPPNHYRLLALEEFESNLDVIENAADQRMAHVRMFQSGPHGEISQQLLNEITAAKLCLLNLAKKAEYDLKLRAEKDAAEPRRLKPLPRLVPTVAPTEVYRIASDVPSAVPSADGEPRGRRRLSPHQTAMIGAALGTLVVAVIFYATFNVGGQDAALRGNSGKSAADRNAAGTAPVETKTHEEATRGETTAKTPDLIPKLPSESPVPLKPTARTFAGTRAAQEWSENSLKLTLCWCPSGRFTMGSPKDEKGPRSSEDQIPVTISRGFWLGKYEVTQSQWELVMGTTLREQRDKADKDKSYALYGEGATQPMEYVTHHEATEFCHKLTQEERRAGRLPADWEYRLPTEAQWEYACRAGTKTATAFGDRLSSEQANFNGNFPYNGAAKGTYLEQAAAVGSYKPNAWGLHDMHGNVWEWCRDWYKEILSGGTDPDVTDKASARVVRGGGWHGQGWHCRSAFRNRQPPDFRAFNVGFRVAAVQVSK